MKSIKLGVIKEGKTPPDKRVPLTPEQCKEVQIRFPHVEVLVQSSDIRAFSDAEYEAEGVQVVSDVNDCDILIGVKEVPKEQLISNKTYLFFSHTYKKQSYNKELLKEILKKKIRLIDYELLKDEKGKRLIGFGRYAGIVGCYNGFRLYGEKYDLYELKPAHECKDRSEMEQELRKVSLPNGFRIVLTGAGRVGNGAKEILEAMRIEELSPEEFLVSESADPAYTQLDSEDYNQKKDGGKFTTREFYDQPELFESTFMRFARVADLYIACHYWDSKAPLIVTKEETRQREFKIKAIADISCDIDGPIASTIRPSTINQPFYGYDPKRGEETDLKTEGSIAVMAVDNLPCELPRDASEDFGNELIFQVFPHLFAEDNNAIIEGASETDLKGNLTSRFAYLRDWVNS